MPLSEDTVVKEAHFIFSITGAALGIPTIGVLDSTRVIGGGIFKDNGANNIECIANGRYLIETQMQTTLFVTNANVTGSESITAEYLVFLSGVGSLITPTPTPKTAFRSGNMHIIDIMNSTSIIAMLPEDTLGLRLTQDLSGVPINVELHLHITRLSL